MSELLPNQNTNLVIISNNQPKTTSLKIAEYFGKLHKDVLEKIKNLETSEEFRERNFTPSQYGQEMPTGGVKQNSMYEITFDGFIFLTMGFTGKKASKHKEDYIYAFNKMRETLQKQIQTPKPNFPNLDSRFLRQMAEKMDQLEREKQQIIQDTAPSVQFALQVHNSINSVTVADFAKTLGTGEIRLFEWLRENGYLMDYPKNIPFQRFITDGYFKVITKTRKNYSTGEDQTYFQTLITGKGQTYLTKKWLNIGQKSLITN